MAGFERAPADWLSYQEALGCVLEGAGPTPAEQAATNEVLGRSLAEPVRASATLPAWNNSAMDGFAVRSNDLPNPAPPNLRLPVAAVAYPGSVPLDDVPAGFAVRITTGAPLPVGFDSVIRVEHTDGEAEPGFVAVHRIDDLGRHVRAAGQDLQAGREAVPAGSVVHSGSLALLLACGRTEVAVRRRPRVGVLSSGSELAGPSRFRQVAQGRAVPDSNRGMIAAGVAEAGGKAVDLGVVADDATAIGKKIERLDELDVLVVTGGASMGERDLVKSVLARHGFELRFWRARVRPGSPVSFGFLPRAGRRVPVFGLPGNPASAFVAFHVLAVPYLRALLGVLDPRGVFAAATAGEDLTGPRGATQFLRVRLDRGLASDGPCCWLAGPQGSGLVRSLRDADGLAVVPEDVGRVARGEHVRVMLLPGARQ